MLNNPIVHQEHGGEKPSLDSGAPVPVTVDYVDAQLTELWRDVAEAAQAKGGVSAVTMAQVLNLIVRADSYNSANEYVQDIDYITGSHPARVITMITDPNEEEMPVQAWVSIHLSDSARGWTTGMRRADFSRCRGHGCSTGARCCDSAAPFRTTCVSLVAQRLTF